MSILGNRVVRREDPKFLTSGGSYVDDLDLPGAAHVTYVRSTMAHARITGVDVSEARNAPGVIAVFTSADLGELQPLKPEPAMLNQAMVRPWLASDTVRFVGEPLAAIVTEEKYQGEDAAELVWPDYEPLAAVVDPEAARAGDTLLFPEAGSNICLDMQFGSSDSLFDDCDVVVTQRVVNQRVAPCPLEVRAAAVRWDGDKVTQWASTQGAHSVRDDLSRLLDIPPENVRAVAPDVGGGFGAKIGIYPEELLLAWLARQVGRPLRWVETRSESMMNLGHGRGQLQQVELGGTRDGKLLAYRLNVLQDAGAYPRIGAVLPFMTRTMLTGVYDVSKAEFNSTSVVTNTTPTVAYRGAGRPEATDAIERAIDLFAAEIGKDPAEVRRQNLLPSSVFPYTTLTGTEYDTGDYPGSLERALEAAGYEELRAEQQRRRDSGDVRQLGIGLSVYVEITGGIGGKEFGAITIKPDGGAVVRAGTSSHGQGHATAFAMIVSDRLGIPLDDIEFVQGDTDLVPFGQGTMGSRSLQSAGVAVSQASDAVADKAREIAAELLEANPDDVVLDAGGRRFHVAGTPAVSKSWSEVVRAAGEDGLAEEVYFDRVGATFPFGAHVSVVEVDTETGKVTVLRHVACDDAGTILNPLLVDGQVHGGIAQGMAQALLEEVRYDDDGNPITSNLADYAFPSAAELPSFERVPMETPTPLNPLGAKGIGESGTIGSTPAVQNAVIDALAHLGVRHIDMPCTAERVWHAIKEAGPGS